MNDRSQHDSSESIRHERWLVALCLLAALLLRSDGISEPWSGKGFNSALSAFGTAEFVQNFNTHGVSESLGMPYRWRVELADGTVEREWYAHHPVGFTLVSLVSSWIFGPAEWAIRLPWILLSMLLPWLAWRSVRELFGARVALGALASLVAVPLAAHYAQMPWVDNGVLTATLCCVVTKFIRWLESGEHRDLRQACVWMLAASLLDWTAAMVLPGLGVLALVCAFRHRSADGVRWCLLGGAALLPAMLGLSILLHTAHMLTVIGWEQLLHDFTSTWGRTRTARLEWMSFHEAQANALLRNLTVPLVVALGLGAIAATGGVMRRRISGLRAAALVVLLLPGVFYVYLFPFRGANHDFMWTASLGGIAALVGLAYQSLDQVTARWRGGRVIAGIALFGLVACGAVETLQRNRSTRSSVLRLASQHPQIAPFLNQPDAVIVTAMGQSWTLMPYSTTPIIPRVERVDELERLRDRVLSRLGSGRSVYFLFDIQFSGVHAELLSYLKASGSSTIVLDGQRADPSVAFAVFDLTDWAGR